MKAGDKSMLRFALRRRCVVLVQVIGKSFNRACILAWRDEDHAPGVRLGD
jgi:hypothetical protein